MKSTSKRAIKYQNKAVRSGKCWKCQKPVARACENKSCEQKGVVTLEAKCPGCGRRTKKRRLCPEHLAYDKNRAANKRKNLPLAA